MNGKKLGEEVKSFKEAVLKAIESYNHFRSPEATAKLVKMDKDELIVDFEGSFCRTCGTYDWLEDFIYELKRFVNVELEIVSFENYRPEKIRVKYSVRAIDRTN